MKILTLILGALVLAGAIENKPGVTVSTSIDGINQLSHLVSPYVFRHMKKVALPNVEFTGGEMTNIEVTLKEPRDKLRQRYKLSSKTESSFMKPRIISYCWKRRPYHTSSV